LAAKEEVVILNNTNNGSSIGRWISILHRHGQSYIGRMLEPYNIGSGQYIFLLILFRNDGISQGELSARLKIDKATTAKAIKKLAAAGYVKREVDAIDKRAYQVFLTPQAMAVRPIVQDAINSWEKTLTANLSENETVLLKQLLDKIAQNACRIKTEVNQDFT
jgi:DNA-binding MarR family transcriptional regulator